MGVFCWFLGISRVLAMADEQEFSPFYNQKGEIK